MTVFLTQLTGGLLAWDKRVPSMLSMQRSLYDLHFRAEHSGRVLDAILSRLRLPATEISRVSKAALTCRVREALASGALVLTDVVVPRSFWTAVPFTV